ncbi:MAG: DUF438 domain-containing protein [Desulfobacterales bacterium]|jgi:DUF438 domain-containing protein|nr:DUF438 domain-containing protein [Desulfobacteraceae bacterium]MDH3825901.1 DUF438 domain-containing protein [Desulfobacterales bacterium]MDH4011472.1 DUF438 domain-containing protein [Desulfobacterales bacterium]
MEINAATKIDELLKEYPFLEDFLVKLSPKFKGLRNPIMRKTIGKVATLSKVAGIGGLDLTDFLASLTAEINRQTDKDATPDGSTPDGAAGAISDPEEKQAALKEIIKALHAGEDMAVLKQRFGQLIDGVEATEIAKMEQALMDEGLPAEEIKRLCDVHVEIFKEALEEQDRPEPPMGHPIHTFMKENRASEKIMSETSMLMGRIGHSPRPEAFKENRGALRALVERLSEIDTHYTRKENQLFPMLEAHHFTGPSQVMWSIHDDIRAGLKQARDAIGQSDAEGTLTPLKEAIQAIRDMIYKEEHILYPASLDMLTDPEWIKVKEGEADIGFAWVVPDTGWPEDIIKGPEDVPPEPAEVVEEVAGALGLDTGRLTLQQINLMLTHLPVDLTFVDENDRVAYYSEGPERIFPRSPAIIGREVRNCHPPKSVHLVNQILDAFKSGSRDTAEFWIELGGKFIYIRYFAVRDKTGYYRGCLEVSQELTKIRKLEGQQRLLDWE